jgi:hypothetical protein
VAGGEPGDLDADSGSALDQFLLGVQLDGGHRSTVRPKPRRP